MALYNGRILMRGGNEADFDPDKMIPREWAISTDKRIVRICFAPGICIRMATYDAFEKDMEEIQKILENCRSIEEAVVLINTQVSRNADAVVEYTQQAKKYRDEAEQFRNEAQASAEQAEAIKNNDYNYAVNKPKINGIELQDNKTLEELNIQPRGDYCIVDDAGHGLNLSIDNSNYLMTLQLLNSSGTVLSEKTIDFPIESMIVNASYLSGVLTLTLQNGQTLPVNISAIISGLVNDSFEIAGIDMKDNITAEELKTALSLDKVANAVPIANLLTTVEGSPLDATMGKLLDEKIAEMQENGGGGKYYAGTCATAAGTSSKVVTISGFQLKIGAIVHIRFSYTNTSSTATLNVSSTGAVPMYYKDGTRMYYIPAGVYHSFIYDGTYWRYLGSESSLIGTRSYERYGLKMSESALVPVISGYNPTLGSSSSKMGTIYSSSIGTDSYPTTLIYGDTVYANVLYAKTGIYRTRMLPPLPLLYGHFTIASFHTITIGSNISQNYVKSLYTGYLNANGDVNSSGCASPGSPQGYDYDIVFIFRIIGYDSSAGKQAVPFVQEFALSTAYTSNGCEDQSSDWYTFVTPCGNKVYFYLSGVSTDSCGNIYGEPVLNIIGTTTNVHFSEIALMP